MEPKKRKGRPLLVAAMGVAFVSYVHCEPKDRPVGNLRGPEPAPDAEIAVGNLMAVPTDDAAAPADAGTLSTDAARVDFGDAGGAIGPITSPTLHPVGNLRPPPPPPHPVGNLRPPPRKDDKK